MVYIYSYSAVQIRLEIFFCATDVYAQILPLCQPFKNLCCLYLHVHVYVAANFLSKLIFAFLLFLVMVMYAYEVETKEK